MLSNAWASKLVFADIDILYVKINSVKYNPEKLPH